MIRRKMGNAEKRRVDPCPIGGGGDFGDFISAVYF
jgi:hypothetical protein